jgi:hypothetical protein
MSYPIQPFRVGDRVMHSAPYHSRLFGGMPAPRRESIIGTVTEVHTWHPEWGNVAYVVVRWDVEQRPTDRSYPVNCLDLVQGETA